MTEAARHFFDALRQLDAQKVDFILAEWFPEEGLGRALNDKLRRASVRE
ncbi:MAG: Sua5 family C-terminal domain-containing protein [Bacteroidota bacterium]